MSSGLTKDLARQAANVVGALFQVGATAAASVTIQEVVDQGPRSLVEPALYAFAIWALIFALSLAYAAYGALPANRENPLLRRAGWFTAGAFFCTGMWSVFVPLRQFALAQLMLLGIFAFLLFAYLRLARYASERGPGAGERWLVALPLGPFLGWVTAANAVSLTAEAVRRGLVTPGSAGEAALGAVLLLLGSLLACAVILAERARAGLPDLRRDRAVGVRRHRHQPVRRLAGDDRGRPARRRSRRGRSRRSAARGTTTRQRPPYRASRDGLRSSSGRDQPLGDITNGALLAA